MYEDKIAVADSTQDHKGAVHISSFYFLSNFSSSLKIFVSLSDFEHSYQISMYLPPLKSFHIIFEDFLMVFWLPALAAAFPDIPFDVFVSH